MSQHPAPAGGQLEAEQFRTELLGRLGLDAKASDQDVETAHDELVEFLEQAPHEVRAWATARSTDADEAFALLSGPAEHLSAAVPARAAQAPASGPRQKAAVPQTSSPAVTRAAVLAAFKPGASKWWWAVLPVVLAAVVLGVYNFGGGSSVPGISGTPTDQPSATAAAGQPATVPVDKAKVADLMTKISANPKDVASLLTLGDVYFAAADYKTAAVWEQKVLTIDPKNQGALLALGAAKFNAGNAVDAEKTWLVAAGLYPKLAEVHYDLGFLYLSQAPPDTAKVRVEWNKVVAIDPTSAVAKTVATHLKSLDSPSSSPSAAPSPK